MPQDALVAEFPQGSLEMPGAGFQNVGAQGHVVGKDPVLLGLQNEIRQSGGQPLEMAGILPDVIGQIQNGEIQKFYIRVELVYAGNADKHAVCQGFDVIDGGFSPNGGYQAKKVDANVVLFTVHFSGFVDVVGDAFAFHQNHQRGVHLSCVGDDLPGLIGDNGGIFLQINGEILL